MCALWQIKAFLEGTGEVRFRPVEDDEGRYSHLQAVLKRFVYPQLKREDKGLVLRYLGRTTGYSRSGHGRAGRVWAQSPNTRQRP